MPRSGDAFEKVVKDVLGAMDPTARARQGEWVVGPDGRRELDVLVEGTVEGVPRRALIECKDFNPKTTGPVGIGFVDALESKRRDLGVDVAFICSNAGFTADAIRKAKRVGIGLIGVLRENDERLRYDVSEEIYIRRINIEQLTISLRAESPIGLGGGSFDGILFNGVPVGNWVRKRVMLLLGANPIVAGAYTVSHALREPLEFELPNGAVVATGLDFHLRISGGWFAQQVTFDATGGLYDWIRRRVRLVPGPSQFHLKDVDLQSGEPIDRPPDTELDIEDLRRGEMWMWFLVVEKFEPQEPVPALDEFILPADLEVVIRDLPEAAFTSNR